MCRYDAYRIYLSHLLVHNILLDHMLLPEQILCFSDEAALRVITFDEFVSQLFTGVHPLHSHLQLLQEDLKSPTQLLL